MRLSLFIVLIPLLLFTACFEEPPTAIPQPSADADMIPAGRDEEVGSQSHAIESSATSDNPSRYDRKRAVNYARYYAMNPNPKVAYCMTKWSGLASDCTNFVSQALWYGGLRTSYSGNADSGWWYSGSCDDSGSSRSWRQVNRLIYWLTVESKLGKFVAINEVKEGDLIFYKLPDEYGHCTEKFVFHHSTMVTGFGETTGTPLVSYHSREIRDIPWNWSMRESGFAGLGDACSYVAIHIQD